MIHFFSAPLTLHTPVPPFPAPTLRTPLPATLHLLLNPTVAATTSLDSNIRLWDVELGKPLKVIDAGAG